MWLTTATTDSKESISVSVSHAELWVAKLSCLTAHALHIGFLASPLYRSCYQQSSGVVAIVSFM